MEEQERRRRWGGRGEEEEEDENEQKQPGGFYLESHPLARHCSIIIASLFVFVSSSHTCTHARTRLPNTSAARTCATSSCTVGRAGGESGR